MDSVSFLTWSGGMGKYIEEHLTFYIDNIQHINANGIKENEYINLFQQVEVCTVL